MSEGTTHSDHVLQTLRTSAVALGEAYAKSVENGDEARALACAQQLLIRFADAIPHEDEFNSAHALLLNLLFALQEIGAGRLDHHPILRGRNQIGGVGQLAAHEEARNGLGAATMLFLINHGISEHGAAKLVSGSMGVSVMTTKNWIAAPKRKLLKATAATTLDRLEREFKRSQPSDVTQFAKRWLRKQLIAMITLSTR